MLQSMGSQRVGHDWVTEQQQHTHTRTHAYICMLLVASLVAQIVKNLPAMQAIWVQSLGREDSLEKGMATHSSFWPGEFHGQISLVGLSPWGCEESDKTEQLSLLAYICY